MKVLQINSVCGVGSTGRIATDIHKMLIEQGHESYIAYGRGEAKNCNNSIRIGNNFDVLFHVLLTRLFDMHGFGSKRATKKFIKQIEEINPDVIHLHNIHGYYINIEVLFNYLKESDKKVVWTLHDCWAFTGHCAYFDYVGCDKWKTGCGKCPQKKSYPNSIFLDQSKKYYQKKNEIFYDIKNLTLVTPSNWLSNLVKISFLKEYPIQVINNGIDLSIFKPTESDFRGKYNLEDKFIILGVANIWDKRKGFEYFLGLSAYLLDDEVIVMVGLTKEQVEIVPKNIIGISRTENIKELASIYSSSDVFINPTLEDNFPNTNLESLACGTPIITFNTGGSIEAVNSKCGIVTDDNDLLKLIKAINEVKKNTKKKFEDNCISECINKYSKSIMLEKYISIYSS